MKNYYFFYALLSCLLLHSAHAVPSKVYLGKNPNPYEFNEDWFTPKNLLWQKHLAEYVGRPNVSYLEVGVWEGRSFFWTIETILTGPFTKAVGLDVFLEPRAKEVFLRNLRNAGNRVQIDLKAGLSKNTLRQLMGTEFDIIYVDGSHFAKSVSQDLVMSWELLTNGGIFILDDYGNKYFDRFSIDAKASTAIDFFLTNFYDEFILLHKGDQVILKKKLPFCRAFGEGASFFDKYCYYWYDRRLMDGPEGVSNLIQISEDEKDTIEAIFRTRKLGHHELDINKLPKNKLDKAKKLLTRLKIEI